MDNFAPRLIEQTRAEAGGKSVLIPVSGGLDSAVAAALLQKASGEITISCEEADCK